MGRAARKPKVETVEQIHAPDAELAVKIYHGDIKPAVSKVGEHNQELSTAYKEIKKRAYIQPWVAKLAFRLDQMEESKRDDALRGLNALFKKLRIFMPSDLVDAAQGTTEFGADVIPAGARRELRLATVGGYEGDNADLAGDGQTDIEQEIAGKNGDALAKAGRHLNGDLPEAAE